MNIVGAKLNIIKKIFFFAWGGVFGACVLCAQQPPVVQDVDVEFRERENVSLAAIYSQIQLKPGMIYRQSIVDESIRSLFATGQYETIEAFVEELKGDEVKVVFVVEPRYRVSEIVFKGNKKLQQKTLKQAFEKGPREGRLRKKYKPREERSERLRTSRSTLKKEVKVEVGGALNENGVNQDVESLIQFYRKKGFALVEIEPEIVKDDTDGTAKVVFNIKEGPKLSIKRITFKGNEHISSSDLKKIMKTKTWGIFAFLTGKGRLNEKIFQTDVEHLREYYKDHGYLDVKLSEEGVEYDHKGRSSLYITINVDEGRRYYLGDISILGNRLYPTDDLMASLPIKKGDVFSPSEVDESSQALRDYYGKSGYLETFVRAERIPDLNSRNIGVQFHITEGEEIYVESVSIQGNVKTKSNVILRELALAPGDVFDTVRMKASEERLKNTGYFKDVSIGPEVVNIPGRRNLKVMLSEKKTASLNFTAGVSNIEKVFGAIEFSQSNFDLFNWRSGFQGGGQKFKLSFTLGASSKRILISFEEPWLFERQLTFGTDLFTNENRYNSSFYNEQRYGFDTYLRKRLFELVNGQITYVWQSVDIRDVSADAPQAILDEKGKRTVSKVHLSFDRDTRDSFLYTTRGNRVDLRFELAGGPLGAQTDYWRVEVQGAQFWSVSSWQNQIISLIGRAGTIKPYSGQEVPFFDRYFLGGSDTMRGFRYRKVGPKGANGEAVGGNSFAFWSVEYTVDFIDPIKVAAYYDWGFVNRGDWSFNPKDYNDDVGFGLRIPVLGSPLRLDFAWPLRKDRFENSRMEFSFSFGTRF